MPGNSLQYTDSPDCSTVPVANSQTSTLTGQANQAEADATCAALLPGGFASPLSVLEPITPELNSDNYYGCFIL